VISSINSRRIVRRGTWLILCFWPFCVPAAAEPERSFVLYELWVPNATCTYARGVSATGEVAGEAIMPNNSVVGFRWRRPGSLALLPTSEPGTDALVCAMSPDGMIAGAVRAPNKTTAVLWFPGHSAPTALPDLGANAGARNFGATNRWGSLIVGYAMPQDPPHVDTRHAVAWHGLELIDYGAFGQCAACFTDLNERGLFVGWASPGGVRNARAFVFDGEQFSFIALPLSVAYAVNDHGVVVGQHLGNEGPLAFRWTVAGLGYLADFGEGAAALDVAEFGIIVGSAQRDDQWRAVLWLDRFTIIDLAELTGAPLTEASAICAGFICGRMSNDHSFLLVLLDEPRPVD